MGLGVTSFFIGAWCGEFLLTYSSAYDTDWPGPGRTGFSDGPHGCGVSPARRYLLACFFILLRRVRTCEFNDFVHYPFQFSTVI